MVHMETAIHFLCCQCDHRFAETAAIQTEVLGFVEYCCPACGSDDVEDEGNLLAVRAMKRTAKFEGYDAEGLARYSNVVLG
jgi:hypothetical protein